MRFREYSSFDYQQASKEASRLLADAIKSGRWFDVPERLIALRTIMLHHDGRNERQAKLKLG